MFEGKVPRKGEAHPLGTEREEGEFLRELSWADLVARLEVSRGRGEAAEQSRGAVAGSFDAGCAKRIAAHHNGKSGVNLDGSSNGKEAGSTGPEGMKGAGGGFAPVPRGSK